MFAIGLSGLSAASAQSVPAQDAVRQGATIQQQQQQVEREQRDRVVRSGRPPSSLEATVPPPAPRGDGPCLAVRTVEVTGTTLLSPAERDAIVAPRLRDCLDAAGIDAIMTALTARYVEKGYAAARVYLLPQDLGGGTLRLRVEEGQVSRVTTTTRARGRQSFATALPGVTGRPLNLRTLEQGLDQINRLPSNHATMAIRPGATSGDSEVVIDNVPTRRLYGSLAYDDRGQSATGRRQGTVNLGWDNALGLNDTLFASHRRTLPARDTRAAVSTSLYYVVPRGRDTLTVSALRSRQDSVVQTANGTALPLRGAFDLIDLDLGHVLWRGRDGRVTMNLGLSRKTVGNRLAGIRLAVSSYTLTAVDAGLAMEQALAGGRLTAHGGLTRGLPWFGATPDVGDDDRPRARFVRFNAGIGYTRPLTLGTQAFTLATVIEAQKAAQALYGAEQFVLGGLYTVRSSVDAIAAANDGFYVRNDLAAYRSVTLGGRTLAIQPHVGLDYGRLSAFGAPGAGGRMASANAGAAATFGPVRIEALAAHPFATPRHVGAGDSLYLSVQLFL